MKNQTALQWLIEQVHSDEYTHAFGRTYISIYLIEQAIEMEKEQIIYAFGQGSLFDPVFPDQFHYRADDYYQHHYGI
jgi:hypothetical protein